MEYTDWGGGGSPDLFHTCCTNQFYCGVPYNTYNLNFQNSYNGNAYCGIQVADNGINEYREYIQSKLIKSLTSGYSFCVKFYCNLSDNSNASIKTLGAYFDNGSVWGSPNGLISVLPQVYNTFYQLSDTLNWMRIENSFVATGTEEYITIGNFFSNQNSNVIINDTTNIFWFTYYFVDNISVIPTNLPAYAGNDTLIQHGDSVFIGRQPEIGLDEDCIWFVNGLPIDTVAGLWVQPDSTTSYIVQQTICGNVKWDTVTVSVYGTGVDDITHGLTRGFRVYPNPATNVLTIESPISNGTLSISNLLGQVVLRQPINDKVSQIDISKLGKGIYFIYLQLEKGVIVKRFLKE